MNANLLDLRRLAAGAVVLAALLVPLYFIALRGGGGDPAVAGSRLVDTPAGKAAALQAGLSDGSLAPDFEVPTPDGSRIRLSELRGRPVIINFWATWCGSCLAEMPLLKDFQAELGTETFTVLAINAGEDRDRALEFIDFLDAPFVYGLDPSLVVTDAYGVYGLPLTVFIDSEGVIQATYRGETQRPILEELTRSAIDATPPGELPVVLRLVSTIVRDRLLLVSYEDVGRLRFESKTLRCDAAYCASAAVAAAESLPGVTETEYEGSGANPRLVVRFDPARIDREAVVGSVIAALEAETDPLYDREVVVQYAAAGSD